MIGIFHARSVVLILLLSAAAPDSALAGCRIKDMLLGTSSRDSSHKAETLDFGSLASDSHYYSAEKLRQLYERAHPKGHATQEQKRELMSGALVDTQDLLFKRREGGQQSLLRLPGQTVPPSGSAIDNTLRDLQSPGPIIPTSGSPSDHVLREMTKDHEVQVDMKHESKSATLKTHLRGTS